MHHLFEKLPGQRVNILYNTNMFMLRLLFLFVLLGGCCWSPYPQGFHCKHHGVLYHGNPSDFSNVQIMVDVNVVDLYVLFVQLFNDALQKTKQNNTYNLTIILFFRLTEFQDASHLFRNCL